MSLGLAFFPVQAPASPAAPSADTRAQDNQSQLGPQGISRLQAQAASGDSSAELKLARAYWQGDGVPVNQETAAQWCRKAAVNGNAEAQEFLGEMYRTGEGVVQDKKEAVAWYQIAARQGDVSAMFNLGAAYYNGDGVSIDDELSYAWFTLAKDAGSEKGAQAVQRAESELKDWNITNSFKKIAEMYEKGGARPENQAEAARWWMTAAKKGDQDAQIQIANKLLNGQGVTRDLTQGRYWCNELAKAKDFRGEYCMALIYQRGLGVNPDAKEARKWYDLAAEAGDVPAIRAVAQMDATGEGGKIDRPAACLQYARLAAAGDKDALQSLARLRKEIDAKELARVEQQLGMTRIDLKKLDAALAQIATQ